MMHIIDDLGSIHQQDGNDTVTFQGVKFNLSVRVDNEAFCLNTPLSMKRLVAFMSEIEK